MTRIDFYILEASEDASVEEIACRLAEKGLAKGSRVYIQCRDRTQAESLDKQLWSFRENSFVPHSTEAEDEQIPVCLGTKDPPLHHHDLLINLSGRVPEGYARFERILEVVPGDHQARQASREVFAHYRDRGYPLNTHSIG